MSLFGIKDVSALSNNGNYVVRAIYEKNKWVCNVITMMYANRGYWEDTYFLIVEDIRNEDGDPQLVKSTHSYRIGEFI